MMDNCAKLFDNWPKGLFPNATYHLVMMETLVPSKMIVGRTYFLFDVACDIDFEYTDQDNVQ